MSDYSTNPVNEHTDPRLHYPPPPPSSAYTPGPPVQPPSVAPRRPLNALAVTSLVVSLAALVGACFAGGFLGLLGVVGAVLGHVARRQIAETGESGKDLAVVGIIVGWVVFGLVMLAAFLVLLAFGGLMWLSSSLLS